MSDLADVSVSLAEIARIAGVGRAAVSNWRRRLDTFPAPVGGSDASPLFPLTEVEQWLREQGKVSDVRSLERIWPQFEALGDRTLVGRAIAEMAASSLGGQPVVPAPNRAPIPEAARQLVHAVACSGGREDAQEMFDFLLSRWLDANVRQISVTPAPLAELMAEIAEAFYHGPGTPTSVLDPACGAGGLLLAAGQRWAGASGDSSGFLLAGTDRDPALASLAAARLSFFFAGCRVPPADGVRGDIRAGDSLRDDPHSQLHADVILSNPPFGQRDWGHEELATDPRWTYGLPPRTEPELAWIQQAVARLKPGGIAVLLIPPTVASRRAGRRIRGALLRAGVLRSVIALPAGSAAPYSVSLHMWVLRSPAPDAVADAGGHVVLLDATASHSRAGGRMQPADWPLLREHVLSALRSDLTGRKGGQYKRGSASAPPVRCAAVPVMSLLDEQVDLTPARYTATERSVSGSQFRGSWQRFDDMTQVLRELATQISRLDLADHKGKALVTTVGDLDRAQALAISSGRETDGDLTLLASPQEGAVPMLMVPDLLRDGKPGSWISAEQAARTNGSLTLAEPGDVIVVGVERGYQAWVQADGPVALGPRIYSLRPDPALLDPWFVAGCLRAPANMRQAGTHTSSASRIDVRKLQVLQLLIADQRRYAQAFRQLAAMEEALFDVRTLGADLVRGLSDGLSAGRLRREPVPPTE